jgi:hypothetical protein
MLVMFAFIVVAAIAGRFKTESLGVNVLRRPNFYWCYV